MALRHATVELDFGDGTYTFRLGLDEIEELERKCESGIYSIWRRLHPDVRDPRLGDILQSIRLGLIGGGMTPIDALVLVRRYVDERPLEESRDVAYAVVGAGLMRLYPGTLEKAAASGEAKATEPPGSTSSPSEATPD